MEKFSNVLLFLCLILNSCNFNANNDKIFQIDSLSECNELIFSNTKLSNLSNVNDIFYLILNNYKLYNSFTSLSSFNLNDLDYQITSFAFESIKINSSEQVNRKLYKSNNIIIKDENKTDKFTTKSLLINSYKGVNLSGIYLNYNLCESNEYTTWIENDEIKYNNLTITKKENNILKVTNNITKKDEASYNPIFHKIWSYEDGNLYSSFIEKLFFLDYKNQLDYDFSSKYSCDFKLKKDYLIFIVNNANNRNYFFNKDNYSNSISLYFNIKNNYLEFAKENISFIENNITKNIEIKTSYFNTSNIKEKISYTLPYKINFI